MRSVTHTPSNKRDQNSYFNELDESQRVLAAEKFKIRDFVVFGGGLLVQVRG